MNELILFFKKGDDKVKDYKEVWHLDCKCLVNRCGDVYTENSKGVMVHRTHRYNHDGYAVVSACSRELKRSYSLQVHILVAKGFVYNPDTAHYTEINHLDFNRANPCADNLEWCTHKANIDYSFQAGHYVGKFGVDNPNYGNTALSEKYQQDKALAKEKQSRPRGRNGKAVKCCVTDINHSTVTEFDCQRDAIDWLIKMAYVLNLTKEHLIKQLKRHEGYCGWELIQL